MAKKSQQNTYLSYFIVFDFVAAIISWILFFIYRKIIIEQSSTLGFKDVINDDNFILGITIIPFFWILLYSITNTYKAILKKDKIHELSKTIWQSIFGTVILFFTLLLNDKIDNYKDYYKLAIILFLLHFILTALFRWLIIKKLKLDLKQGKIFFATLLIGAGKSAQNLLEELKKHNAYGHRLIGYVSNDSDSNINGLINLGTDDDIESIIASQKIEEVIIATEARSSSALRNILKIIDKNKIGIKVIPDLYDLLYGSVKLNNVFGAPLIDIDLSLLKPWQQLAKSSFDYIISTIIVILLAPVYIVIALLIKTTSPGKIFYLQERIGINGQPFKLIKFRTMHNNSEDEGPQLTQNNDGRITKIGKVLRKIRLDEIPNFFNVLKGNMSIVGPRPERQYFIDKIVQSSPEYSNLHRIKPGITSLGMVKFGYASNMEEMTKRMKYDLLYLENMSLELDLKIIWFTFLTIIKQEGK